MKTHYLVAICLAVVPSVSGAVVIGFDNLSGENTSFYAGHNEMGFAIAPTDGPWRESTLFLGAPKPCIYFGPPRDLAYIGTIRIQRSDGRPFVFNSVDAYNGSPNAGWFWYRGYRNGVLRFLGFQSDFRAFNTLRNEYVGRGELDNLELTLEAPGSATTLAFDNIDVTPVPEPGGWLVLLSGACLFRRRSTVGAGR